MNGTLITTKKINDKVGSNHILKLFSKDISVATEAPKYISINNILETRINSIQIFKHKGSVDLKLRIGKQEIISEITLKSYKNLKLKKGLKVYALVKAISIVGK